MSWSWRTKPRSIIRTIQWFIEFGKFEGKDWDYVDPINTSIFDGKKIHPVRREYIYAAHSSEDVNIGGLSLKKYISGQCDTKETESNGRNDKFTFEFFGFGYVNENGIIRVNPVGKRIMSNTFDGDDYLKQLLKLQFPNPFSQGNDFKNDDYVYPMQLVLKCFEEFESLNRSEIVLLFGCNNFLKIDSLIDGIRNFKNKYDNLDNKKDTSKVKLLCEEIYIETYGSLDNEIDTYYDYAEAFCRCLNYTGLFKLSGKSLATKVRIAEHSKIKYKLLLEKYAFERKNFKNKNDYMEWFGDCDSTQLPWDNKEARVEILKEKVSYLEKISSDLGETILNNEISEKINNANKYIQPDSNVSTKDSDLKDEEKKLVEFITNLREKQYIQNESQTKDARDEIINMYDQIIKQIDMGALWLEVNTWKSLLAINGEKIVKRNFNVEEDLTPKSFAPGIGNTPDMELYYGDYIIIPEVSLMTGTRQWEHEASSVIDHVLSFINDNEEKTVRGLFISTEMNIRTKWQFFILNKESWVGKPVPVIPLTINQYKEILKFIYSKEKNIEDFIKLIDEIHEIALTSKNYNEWFDSSNRYINKWKRSLTVNLLAN